MINEIDFNISVNSIDAKLDAKTKRLIEDYVDLIGNVFNPDYSDIHARELCIQLDACAENLEKIEINGYCYDDTDDEFTINLTIK